MKISLCMIVKNEEKSLAACLRSVQGYIDEIIVVDTGSTDATKEIAREFTGHVIDFSWCHDFSKARNFAVAQAKNDWILILDADECIIQFDQAAVNDRMISQERLVGRIKLINPCHDGMEAKQCIERVNRLFNRKYYHYQGIIHEQIVAKDGEHYPMSPVDITVEHFGYTREALARTGKLERNARMLQRALAEHPLDPYLHYQLGKTLFMAKDYEAAAESFRQAMLAADRKYEYVQDLIESYGYALLKSGQYEKALPLAEHRDYYSTSADYLFLLGNIFMNNAQFADAIEVFKQCTGLTEGRIAGNNSYRPLYNIGVIYETLGNLGQAAQFYRQCGDYGPAMERLKEICANGGLLMRGNSSIGVSAIRQLIEAGEARQAGRLLTCYHILPEKDADYFSMMGIISLLNGEFDEAERVLLQGYRHYPESFDICYNLGYLYQLREQKEQAYLYLSRARQLAPSAEEIQDVNILLAT